MNPPKNTKTSGRGEENPHVHRRSSFTPPSRHDGGVRLPLHAHRPTTSGQHQHEATGNQRAGEGQQPGHLAAGDRQCR